MHPSYSAAGAFTKKVIIIMKLTGSEKSAYLHQLGLCRWIRQEPGYFREQYVFVFVSH